MRESQQRNNAKFRKTPKGVLTNLYHKQIERSVRKGFPPPTYTLSEFHDMFLDDPHFLGIYESWANNGFPTKLKPSIDRIDPDKSYEHGNIQIMTWAENRTKGDAENARRITTAIVMCDIAGNELRSFDSIKEAVAVTGLNQALIVRCCQGKRSHTGGYKFKYRGDRFRRRATSLIGEEKD